MSDEDRPRIRRPTAPGWAALGLWTFLLFFLASAPASAFPRLPRLIPWDKIVHAAEWAVWAGLFFAVSIRQWPQWPAHRMFLTTVAVAALGGWLHELFQIPIPGRTCDPADWMADTTGALIATFALAALFRPVRRQVL